MLLLNNYTLPLYRLGAAEARDLPQNPQNSQNLLLGKNLPRNPQNSQNLLLGKNLPRNPQISQNLLLGKNLPRNPQNLLAERRLPQMSQIFTDAAPPKN